MPRPRANITAGDLEILRIIWAVGTCGMREVHDALSADRSIAESTVSNRLAVMVEKKLIAVIDDRRPKQYRAVVQQDSTAGSLVGEVLQRVFGGSTSRMVLHLLSRKRISPEERKAVQDELDKME